MISGDTGARVFLMHMVQTCSILNSQEKEECQKTGNREFEEPDKFSGTSVNEEVGNVLGPSPHRVSELFVS